jgi:ankyrin repeat protein
MKINYIFCLLALSTVSSAVCMEQSVIKYDKRMPNVVRDMLERSEKFKGQCSDCNFCGGGKGLNQEEKWYALICATYYEDGAAVNSLLEDKALDAKALEYTQKDLLGGLPQYVHTFPRLHVLPLTVARYTGNQEIIKALEQKNAVEDKEMVPLCALAAYMGDVDLLNQCIANNDFDPLYNDKLGGSLLKLAARNNHTDMVKRLLELSDIKRHINADRFGGAPVLYIVAQRGFYDAAKQLCQAGADPSIPYQHPESCEKILPIHIASDHKYKNIVELFCEQSAGYIGVGKYCKYGQFALHKALLENDGRTIKVVLSVPTVNKYFYDDYLKKVQDIAMQYGYLRK